MNEFHFYVSSIYSVEKNSLKNKNMFVLVLFLSYRQYRWKVKIYLFYGIFLHKKI